MIEVQNEIRHLPDKLSVAFSRYSEWTVGFPIGTVIQLRQSHAYPGYQKYSELHPVRKRLILYESAAN